MNTPLGETKVRNWGPVMLADCRFGWLAVVCTFVIRGGLRLGYKAALMVGADFRVRFEGLRCGAV